MRETGPRRQLESNQVQPAVRQEMRGLQADAATHASAGEPSAKGRERMIAPPCHTRGSATSDDWITPRWLIEQLGPFDLDPCASDTQPWPCAMVQWRAFDNGLMLPWFGNVFLNPPYGKALEPWLNRLAMHDNGIALVFARTETKAFFRYVWPHASALLFLQGRLTFHYPDGSLPRLGANSGGPSCLIAYGEEAAARLKKNRKLGALVKVQP
jgi:hypothetical protein